MECATKQQEKKITLSKKDSKQREFILNGNMWRVVWQVCAPLAIYQGLNQIFKFLDVMMASHISSEAVSAVAYLSQISGMLGAIGAGLAVGGSITIAGNYGIGDYDKVKKQVNTLMAMAMMIGLALLVLIVPFAKNILLIANTPLELIEVGTRYFIVELFVLVVMFINNVYISIEKSRGNTKRILYLNFLVFTSKFLLTALFVYVFNFGVTMVAVASLCSHIIITIIGFYNLRDKTQVFGFSVKHIKLKRELTWPMIRLAIPIITEKMAFNLGKAVVNSMSVIYGSTVVGALGVSNNIGGLSTSPPLGFQEGGASIISQNLGNGNYERALDAFKKILIINLGIGVTGFLITTVFMNPIVNIFTEGDIIFAEQIISIYKYERVAIILLSVTASVMALLYGFGYTKLSLLINFMRVFVFRIPSLYILQNFTDFGSESIGIAMMISNLMVGVFSGGIGYYVIKRIKRKKLLNK